MNVTLSIIKVLAVIALMVWTGAALIEAIDTEAKAESRRVRKYQADIKSEAAAIEEIDRRLTEQVEKDWRANQ